MGIRIRQAPSGAEIVGTITGQILTWNNTTKRWDVGTPAESSKSSALETFASTIVAANASTTTADGPVHTAASVAGAPTFPVGATLELEWLSTLSGDAAGKVEGSMQLEVSLDGGTVWTPVGLDAFGWFDSVALNNPVTVVNMLGEVSLSGAPSFAIRGVLVNGATAVAGASYADPRVRWNYRAP